MDGGWDILANQLLARGRIPYSAANLGVSVAAHRMAVAYSKTRETFGAPLATRQAIQWMLVDSEVEIRTCRWLTWEAAWKYDAGEDFRQEASIAKLHSAEVLAPGRRPIPPDPRRLWCDPGNALRTLVSRSKSPTPSAKGAQEVNKILIAREILNPGGVRR